MTVYETVSIWLAGGALFFSIPAIVFAIIHEVRTKFKFRTNIAFVRFEELKTNKINDEKLNAHLATFMFTYINQSNECFYITSVSLKIKNEAFPAEAYINKDVDNLRCLFDFRIAPRESDSMLLFFEIPKNLLINANKLIIGTSYRRRPYKRKFISLARKT